MKKARKEKKMKRENEPKEWKKKIVKKERRLGYFGKGAIEQEKERKREKE